VSTDPNAPPPLYCHDCGANVAALGEWYMLEDSIWQQATRNAPTQHLCIGCLEERLGRRLTPDDFHLAAPANATREERLPDHLHASLAPVTRAMSGRLRSRIEGAP